MRTFVTNECSGAITADRLGIPYILPDFSTNLLSFKANQMYQVAFLTSLEGFWSFITREHLGHKTGVVRA